MTPHSTEDKPIVQTKAPRLAPAHPLQRTATRPLCTGLRALARAQQLGTSLLLLLLPQGVQPRPYLDQLSGIASLKPGFTNRKRFSLRSDFRGCLGHWEPLKRQEPAGTVPSAATHVLTDKSGQLFKSIKDCANTTIRGLLALISPEAGAMGELAARAVKMGWELWKPGPRPGVRW